MQLQTLQNEIVQAAQNAPARVSILVQELSAQKPLVEYDTRRRLISASTIKVQILLTILEKIRCKECTLDTSVPIAPEDVLPDSTAFDRPVTHASLQELLFWMICISDNTATNLLIRFVGMDTVNCYCTEQLHLAATKLERRMLDWNAAASGHNNYTSPQDMLHTFQALHQKSILTPELCDYALALLARQQDKTVAFRYIWEPLAAAHKTGGLDGLDHDTGLFTLHGKTWFFGLFATDGPVGKENQQLLGRIFRTLIDYLEAVTT